MTAIRPTGIRKPAALWWLTQALIVCFGAQALAFDPGQFRSAAMSLPKTAVTVPVATFKVPLKLIDIPSWLQDAELCVDCIAYWGDNQAQIAIAAGRAVFPQYLKDGSYQGTVTVKADELYGTPMGTSTGGHCIAAAKKNGTCTVLSVSGQVNAWAGTKMDCGNNILLGGYSEPKPLN